MKKILLSLFIFIIFYGISCGKQSVDTDYKYMYSESNSVQALTASNDGYYFINGLYLYFCDYETMESVVLCNKPNCLHDKELDEKKKYNCNGFLITEGDSKLITTYDNYLYCYIGMDFLKDIWQPELIRISLDGSKRETVCILEQNITSIALHRGKLYYATSVSSDDEQEAQDGIYEYSLKEYDVFKKSAKPIEIVSGKEVMAVIHDITPVGNKVRYTKNAEEDNIIAGKEFVYDIDDKSVNQIAEDINLKYVGPLTISEGDYIFTPISINDGNIEYSDYIYKNNIETGISEKLFKREFSDIMHYSDDNYIYVDNILSIEDGNQNRVITIYDKKGNKVDSIDITANNIYASFISGDEKYMFLRGRNEEKAYIRYADKSKIGTGNLQWQTLFELEAKYLDTTVSK